MAKKLTPASIVSQKKWSSLPITKKRKLRNLLPDHDKDGVPNKYDCRPNNKRKQETFLPADETYIQTDPEIKLGKYISEGFNGEVYELAGNRHFVVKVPLGYYNIHHYPMSERLQKINNTRKSIERELKFYDDLDLYHDPLFIPTKAIDLGTNDLNNGNYIGLLRPKIAPIIDLTKKTPIATKLRVTDSQIRQLREHLIRLSKRGISIDDGLQLGFDIAGRILIYDADGLKVSIHDIPDAFDTNNGAWTRFLKRLAPTRSNCDVNHYGSIVPSGGMLSTRKSIRVSDDAWLF